LGEVRYALYVPRSIRVPAQDTKQILRALPLATQWSGGTFQRSVIALLGEELGPFTPQIQCESFPQALAALLSGKVAAILPTVVETAEPAVAKCRRIPLHQLTDAGRAIVLAWNPRIEEVRDGIKRLAEKLASVLAF
jgi:DNA-binding transcriptional LysR family regulator